VSREERKRCERGSSFFGREGESKGGGSSGGAKKRGFSRFWGREDDHVKNWSFRPISGQEKIALGVREKKKKMSRSFPGGKKKKAGGRRSSTAATSKRGRSPHPIK